MRPQGATHTHRVTTHPKSACSIFKTPSREVCCPPGRRALSVVSEIEKGKSLHFQQEKAEPRSHRWRWNSTGFSLSDKTRGGTMRRSGWRWGKQRGCFGGDDGQPSFCQPVVERDKWSWGRNLGSVGTGALKCQLRFSCGWADAYIRLLVKTRREKPLHQDWGGTVHTGPGSKAGNSECS